MINLASYTPVLRYFRLGFLIFLPGIALPIFFLSMWRTPRVETVLEGMAIVFLELILVHSTGYVMRVTAEKDPLKRRKALGWLLLLYTVFAIPTMILAGAAWPLIALYARALGTLWSGATEEGRKNIGAQIGPQALLYLVTALLMIFLPLPRWGITPEIVSQVRSAMEEKHFKTGGDVASTEPHRIIAWGFMYFTAVAGLAFWRMVSALARRRAARMSSNNPRP